MSSEKDLINNNKNIWGAGMFVGMFIASIIFAFVIAVDKFTDISPSQIILPNIPQLTRIYRDYECECRTPPATSAPAKSNSL